LKKNGLFFALFLIIIAWNLFTKGLDECVELKNVIFANVHIIIFPIVIFVIIGLILGFTWRISFFDEGVVEGRLFKRLFDFLKLELAHIHFIPGQLVGLDLVGLVILSPFQDVFELHFIKI
jgi:hypothetical protein